MKTQCPGDLLLRPDLAHDVLRDELVTADRLGHLGDDDLLRRTGELVGRSRQVEVLLVAHLGEIDARRLYLKEACSSMFAFCTERLHFSEGEAWLRIAACRVAREHPRWSWRCWPTVGCI